jgi:hypothetical protein
VRFFPASVLIILFSACLSEPDCLVTATTGVKMSFRDPVTGIAKNVKFHSIKATSLDAQLVTDSLKSIALPVNPYENETTFIFEYGAIENGVSVIKTDTMTLMYTSETVIISPDCGGAIYHSNLAVKDYSFAKAPKVVNTQLSTLATLNVEVSL